MYVIPNKANRLTLLGGIFLLFVLLLGLSAFAKPLLLFVLGISKMNITGIWIGRSLFWLFLGLIFLYSFFVEKQPLLLIEEKKYEPWVYLASFVAIYAALFAGLFFVSKTMIALKYNMKSEVMEKMMVIFRANKLLLIFTALTAGFVEEFLFRGYLMPRLAVLLKSPFWAIMISSVLFGLIHFGYGTAIQIAAPFLIGLVFAFYYWEFRNIKVLIFCHVAWDLMAIFVKL